MGGYFGAAAPGLSPPSPTGLLIHDTLSARLHPARACARWPTRCVPMAFGFSATEPRPALCYGQPGLMDWPIFPLR